MKRLKHYFNKMNEKTMTYVEIYDGKVIVHSSLPEYEDYMPEYYHDDIMLRITTTHKLAQDRPTLIWYIPTHLLGINTYTNAAADFCLREFTKYIDSLNLDLLNRTRPDYENGKYYLCHPEGEVLARNSTYFSLCPQKDYEYLSGNDIYFLDDNNPRPLQLCLCICMQAQLPRNNIKKACRMLCKDLPAAIDKFISEFNYQKFIEALDLEKTQTEIRRWLKDSEYCAFVANGSILPRSNNSDMPMIGAVPFISTAEDEIEICGIRGLGIKRGVTVITGGGYSGKSTLLEAIAAGVYDHVKGDGRELCITDESAVSISAEDGRSIKKVNISPFIKWLPSGSTTEFSTSHASGSTSQAANIMEAVDYGAKLLIIDEDRSATNFMIRDNVMKKLIEKEPIIPFTDRVRELYRTCKVSTILVIGGSGEYLAVADQVYMMDDFEIRNVTESSKKLCDAHKVVVSFANPTCWEQNRSLLSKGFTSFPEGKGSEKLQVIDLGIIIIGDEMIDLRGIHDIVTPRQLYSIGFMLRYLMVSNNDVIIDIKARIDDLYKKINEEGMDIIYSSFFTATERFLDLPRKQDLFAAINRMRKINITSR